MNNLATYIALCNLPTYRVYLMYTCDNVLEVNKDRRLHYGFSDKSSTMTAKLLIALMLTVTCAISLHCVDARTLRKSSDDVTGDDIITSRDGIVKRSVREVRGGRRTYSTPAVLDVPIMVGGADAGARSSRSISDTRSLLSDDERSRFANLLADVSLLEQLRQRRPTGHHLREVWAAPYGQPDDEDLLRTLEEIDGSIYDIEDGRLAEGRRELPVKRTIGHLRSSRELHPVYLGLGQNAASAALNTYASLLADEKRRESLEQQQGNSANPVRFIGKR